MLGLILIISSLANPVAFFSSTKSSSIQEHAVIQKRRTVLIRPSEVAKQFPNRKSAVVSYPVITGLPMQTLRKVRALLSFKNIFDYTLAEYRADPWLTEFSYVVNHNANHLLDITFSQSGAAAYPDEQSKHFLIDLSDGELVRATDVFHDDKLSALTKAVDEKLQQEIARLRKENAASDRDTSEKDSVNDAYDLLTFELKDLDNFSVSKTGLTFLYDAGFPHVIRALEPKGRYYFSYAQLKPFIKGSGPLGQFVR